jgi:hypothetical protein
VTALQRATGTLATAATARMEGDMSWFSSLSAQERSWVGLIVQAGIRGFVDWYAAPAGGAEASAGPSPEDAGDPPSSDLASQVFGAAPRELTGVISLRQTVDLVRTGIEVVEANLESVLDPRDTDAVRAELLRYAREVAFATAEVYARAAEARGAWDARLEALVVDSVLRAEADETVLSRASALGWSGRAGVVVVLGRVGEARTENDLFDDVRRRARAAGTDALCAAQGERMVVVLGGVPLDGDPLPAASAVATSFGPGPVVVGPVTDDLATAHLSARAALSAHRAADGWPAAPRPVRSGDLLPERALAGDGHARRHLVEELYLPLLAQGALVDTLDAYAAAGGSVEGTARALFVHANTVRYRLRQVTDLSGYDPTDPRDGLTLQVALVLGRQSRRGAPGSL